jgi:hypothetical protein
MREKGVGQKSNSPPQPTRIADMFLANGKRRKKRELNQFCLHFKVKKEVFSKGLAQPHVEKDGKNVPAKAESSSSWSAGMVAARLILRSTAISLSDADILDCILWLKSEKEAVGELGSPSTPGVALFRGRAFFPEAAAFWRHMKKLTSST